MHCGAGNTALAVHRIRVAKCNQPAYFVFLFCFCECTCRSSLPCAANRPARALTTFLCGETSTPLHTRSGSTLGTHSISNPGHTLDPCHRHPNTCAHACNTRTQYPKLRLQRAGHGHYSTIYLQRGQLAQKDLSVPTRNAAAGLLAHGHAEIQVSPLGTSPYIFIGLA